MAVNKIAGFRLADTRLGDTIQAVAMRELGDAARWPELVALNGLAPPYLIDGIPGLEEAEPGGAVIIAGQRIKVPASRPRNAVSDPDDVFGRDIALSGGLLGVTEGGDLDVVADLQNLHQALRHRLATHERELVWHPEYGNPLHGMVGLKASPVNNLLAAAYAERTLRYDPRVDRVEGVTADLGTALASGDTIAIEAEAITVDGRPLPIGGD